MFELTTASKYLIPRKRYFSVSAISLISVFVIAVVVWLTIVFFSATEGLEKRWTEKLIVLTAPVRITPTEQYWESYYAMIDSYAEASQYRQKSLREKLATAAANPYNPERDGQLPATMPHPLRDSQGNLRDLAKEVVAVASSVGTAPDASVFAYDIGCATAKLTTVRSTNGELLSRTITQPVYLVSFNKDNAAFNNVLISYSDDDLKTNKTLLTRTPQGEWLLPQKTEHGAAVVLPRSFRDAGAAVGDTGDLVYTSVTPTTLVDQHMPFYVAAFYDPGIIPVGGRIVLASPEVVAALSQDSQGDFLPTCGMNVTFSKYRQARAVKTEIEQSLKRLQLDPFFTVSSFEEYEFTQDLFQQLKSEKNLFTLISAIIIIVACSNIVSLLIILVHDKAKEIALLRALGASKCSIGCIFGISGSVMGSIGSICGAIAAYYTVKNLPLLLSLIGKLQGFDVLNTRFYGETIPTEISLSAVVLIVVLTLIISTLAGALAAIKACKQNTSESLAAV